MTHRFAYREMAARIVLVLCTLLAPSFALAGTTGTISGTIGAAWFIFTRILRYYFRHRRAETPQSA